jgi:hypothetical protein
MEKKRKELKSLICTRNRMAAVFVKLSLSESFNYTNTLSTLYLDVAIL